MGDLVSIIVPCYNVSKWLDDLFKSLEAQIYKEFEVIFVNDGSKDDTEKLLKDYCNKHTNCKYIIQENQGLSAARNSGLKLADGELVCFVDSDDMLHPNYVSRLHELITNGDYDCATCWYLITKEEQTYEDVLNIKFKHKKQEIAVDSDSQKIVLDYIKAKYANAVWNKIYKMSCLKQMSNFPNVFDVDIYGAEDFDFNYRVFSTIKTIISSNEKLYYYRQRKNSIMHQKFDKKRLKSLLAFDKNYKHCKENFPEAFKYFESNRICHTIGKLMQMKKSGYDSYEEIIPLINYLDENYKKCLKKSLVFAYPLMRAVFFSRTLKKHK